jgi:hypothetical protein
MMVLETEAGSYKADEEAQDSESDQDPYDQDGDDEGNKDFIERELEDPSLREKPPAALTARTANLRPSKSQPTGPIATLKLPTLQLFRTPNPLPTMTPNGAPLTPRPTSCTIFASAIVSTSDKLKALRSQYLLYAS